MAACPLATCWREASLALRAQVNACASASWSIYSDVAVDVLVGGRARGRAAARARPVGHVLLLRRGDPLALHRRPCRRARRGRAQIISDWRPRVSEVDQLASKRELRAA